jgi:phosphopentomutase
VGKIRDIFAGRGVTDFVYTGSNAEGMARTLEALEKVEKGMVFTNLVDFDMLFGHRLDPLGFGRALEEFDGWLPRLLERLRPSDILLITADHGCDPTTPGTDHTREYVPLLAWHPRLRRGSDLGERDSFADVAATIAELFEIEFSVGRSVLPEL